MILSINTFHWTLSFLQRDLIVSHVLAQKQVFFESRFQLSAEELYGERTLKSVNFTRLMIPTVNLTKGEPHVFRSLHLPKAVHDQDVKIADVVVAATAAPTYFPHRQISEDAFVDGAMWSNDPSMLAFAEAMRIQQYEKRAEECFDWVNDSFLQHKRTPFVPVASDEDEILLDDEFGFE